MSALTVSAYECWIAMYPEHKRIVNAHSRGSAKAEYFREVREPLPDIQFTEMRCRKVGKPQKDSMFAHVASLRGCEFAYCGMKVKVGDNFGIIVGAGGGGAYFKILFTTGEYIGQSVYCHPLWKMTYYDNQDNIVFDSEINKEQA